MQHGGRDNDWRHRDWTIPETIRRAAIAVGANPADLGDQKHCLTNPEVIEQYWRMERRYELDQDNPDPLMLMLQQYLQDGKELYAMLVDAGIPWQDARRILPIGTQTYIHGTFNYLALKGVLANRLEHIMDWEINCVTQLMLREIKMKCPPLFSRYLGSHSDLARTAKFDKLESWPPDGKWPSATLKCLTCGHSMSNHRSPSEIFQKVHPQEMVCEVCERDYAGTAPMHVCRPEDSLPRTHRAEQMPFFVLHPDSMNGDPVKWLWTNGNYQDIHSQL
jgi:thymidylate synthase ThyX